MFSGQSTPSARDMNLDSLKRAGLAARSTIVAYTFYDCNRQQADRWPTPSEFSSGLSDAIAALEQYPIDMLPGNIPFSSVGTAQFLTGNHTRDHRGLQGSNRETHPQVLNCQLRINETPNQPGRNLRKACRLASQIAIGSST